MGLFSQNGGMPKFVYHDGEWHDTAMLIADTWVALGAMAWGGYQSYGRGAVVIGENDEVVFWSIAMPALAASRERIATKLRRDCARYRPEREFVILVSGARDEKALRVSKTEAYCGIVAPRSPGVLTPPQAHEVFLAWEKESQLRQRLALDMDSV